VAPRARNSLAFASGGRNDSAGFWGEEMGQTDGALEVDVERLVRDLPGLSGAEAGHLAWLVAQALRSMDGPRAALAVERLGGQPSGTTAGLRWHAGRAEP
jgi:hypothetical protein